MQKQEKGKREKCVRKKAFPLLGNFCTRQTNKASLKFNISTTGQIFIAQIHSSIYSFIHPFIQLLTEYHYVLSMVLGIENSIVIKKQENFALLKLPF